MRRTRSGWNSGVVDISDAHQIGLKCSNGSRQATQRYSALQAVEPKADRRSVFVLPQRGHATACARRPGGSAAPAAPPRLPLGGAMPYSRSLRRPSSLIQSVVQAGRALQRHARGPEAGGVDGVEHALLDHLGGGAAGVGGREHDLEAVVVGDHVAHDAEVAHRQRRHFGVEHAVQHLPRASTRVSRCASPAPSPHAPGIGALQVLHLGSGCSPCARCARRVLPVLRKAESAGIGSLASSSSSRISASHGSRSSSQRGPRPLAAADASTASAVEQLGRVAPQRVERGAHAARAIRRVPSPRRTTQSAECCWW